VNKVKKVWSSLELMTSQSEKTLVTDFLLLQIPPFPLKEKAFRQGNAQGPRKNKEDGQWNTNDHQKKDEDVAISKVKG
jgi:hypothetical protein